MIYNVVFVSGIQQKSQLYIYPLFFLFFPHIGHYRALSRFPCAIQKVLVSSLFYYYLLCIFWPYLETCGILVPCPQSEPVPSSLESRVLTTGPPGKFQLSILYRVVCTCQSQSSNLLLPLPYTLEMGNLFSTSATVFVL